jgi:ribonucleotide monophosphatase NagD (HAD superfamily)
MPKQVLATNVNADEAIASYMEGILKEHPLHGNAYMIGDSQASNTPGENLCGWDTCLVRTGVLKD